MKLRTSWIVFVLLLTACNVSVTSFPSVPGQPASSVTEVPPTPYPHTPAPEVLNASPVEAPGLFDTQFLNELDGWGVTETQIVRTNDGGITWYNVTPPDIAEAGTTVGMFVLDKDHAWVQKPDFNNFPNNGLLYRTVDGGLTWTISSTPFSAGDLSFIDVNNGWMLADLGVGAGSNAVAVFQTTDGGTTWTQTYTNDPTNPDAGDSLPLSGLKSDLVPLDMQTAWVTGVIYADDTAYLFRTNDGGHTWSPVTLVLPAGVKNVQLSIDKDQMKFVSTTDGFLALRVSAQTVIYMTRDAGNTWALTPTLIPGAGSFEFLSAEDVIFYNGEQFHVTRDAAQTWTAVSPNLDFGESFAGMDFVNPGTGWMHTFDINTQHRSLYRTNDGGATWLPVIP